MRYVALMRLLLALCLAVLNALAPKSPSARVAVGATTESAARPAVTAQRAPAGDEALHAARVDARVVAGRDTPAPRHAPPARESWLRAAADLPQPRAARPPPAGADRSHDVAARGGVRPYFPTAPPVEG
jgi:hypothetical protein